MRSHFITVVFLLLCYNLNAQILKGYVIDSEDQRPLINAFVFITNSNIGTSTDSIGYFELKYGDNNKINLTISHLTHEIKNVTVDLSESNELTISLVPKSLELNSFELVSKFDAGKRKKRMKRFMNAFLGSNIKKGSVQILNPEALLLTEKQGQLIAEATEPLRIQNKVLGYLLRFYLKKFRLDSNDDLLYQGSAFFTEIEGKKREMAKYRKNRKKTFANTSRDFFTKMINKELDPEEYHMAFSYQNMAGEFILLKEITADSLEIEQIEKNKFKIPIRGYLTVILKKKKAKPTRSTSSLQGSMRTNRGSMTPAVQSFIKSRINTIYVNSKGAILNALDLEEYGYWTDQRVATLLPFDYSND